MGQFALLRVLLLALTFVAVVAPSANCFKYTCAPVRLTPSYNGRSPCIYYKSNVNSIYVVPCQEEHMQCAFLAWTNDAECSTRQGFSSIAYPGEACSSNDQCSTFNCYNGVCKGAELDESCTDNQDCDVGLACQKDMRCALVQNEGQLCNEDLACASYLHCVNQTCIRYGSIDTGVRFRVFAGQWNVQGLVCKSGEAEALAKAAGPGEAWFICKKGKWLKSREDENCTYKDEDTGELTWKIASCGLSWENDTFCEIASLDKQYQSTFRQFIDYLDSVKPLCSVAYTRINPYSTLLSSDSISLSRKFFCSNWKRLPEFESMKRNFSQNLFPDNYVLLAKTDFCVTKVVDSIYFKKSYVPSFALPAASVRLALVFILLLMLL